MGNAWWPGSAYTGTDVDLVIPEYLDGYKVTRIGYNAFEKQYGMKSVVIPEGVTYIDDYAFDGQYDLEAVTLPSTLEYLGDHNFMCSMLKTVTIPASVKYIGYQNFLGCYQLEEVIFEAEEVDELTIGEAVFLDCQGLKSINLPVGLTELAPATFTNCLALERIELPEGLTSIGEDVFADCHKLKVVKIPSTVEEIDSTAFTRDENVIIIAANDSYARTFAEENNIETHSAPYSYNILEDGKIEVTACYEETDEIVIPSEIEGYTVKGVAAEAFLCNETITSVVVSEGVEYIGGYAFAGCPALQSVTLPDSVTAIGDYAFTESINLTSVNLPENLEYVGELAFALTSVTELAIPASLNEIGLGAFAACIALESFSVDENNETFTAENGVLLSKDKTVLVAYPAGKTETTYEIPETVTTIDDGAFSYAINVEEIIVPEGVTEIGMSAFEGCEALTDITLPESVEALGDCAIPETATVHAPEGSVGAQYAAEKGNPLIVTITSGDVTIVINKTARTVEITGEGAMEEPLYKYLVTKEHYLESIKGAMEGYYGTEVDLEYDETLTDILAIDDNLKYYDHATGEELVIDEDVRKAINAANFLDVSPIRITVGEGITNISDYAFVLCNDVEEVVLPSTVQTIGDGAFLYCGNLKRVILPEDVTIGESAFNYCHKLSLVVLATDDYYAPAPQNDGPMMILDEEPTSTNLTADDVYRLIYC